MVVEVLRPSLPSLVSLVPSLVCVSKKTPPVGSKSRGAGMNHPHHCFGSVSEQLPNSSKKSLIGKKGTFHERAKVVDSLPGYTLGIVGCRHNLAPRAQRSRRRSFSADGTIRPLWSPCVGGRALQRLSVL